MNPIPDPELLLPEVKFTATRSSGPGGQNVNKVNTRVELRFNIPSSAILTPEQKSLLLEKLSSRLTKDGELLIASDKTRSQLKNKENCIDRFFAIIHHAFIPEKPRQATKPTLASRVRRLDHKKQHSTKKQNRKRPDF